MNSKLILCSALLLVSAMGCAQSSAVISGLREVNGKVFLSKGRPLKGGTLVLRPAGGLRPAISADIKSDGSFTIDGASEAKPVLPGEYQVFVVFDKDPKQRALRSQVPKKYQSLSDDESDLYVNIDEESEDVVVKLKQG